MQDKGFLIISYFAVVAVVNALIYMWLCNYMYMAAGVKKNDVKKYISEQVSSRAQRKLVEWLRERADNSREFNIMYFFCSATSFIPAITPIFVFAMIILKLDYNIVKIIMIAEAVITILIAVFGFLYGRKIKEQKEFYFDSSEYKPYEGENTPDEIDDLDELYEDLEEETYNEIDPDKKGKILNHAKKIIIVIIMLMFLFSPVIFKNVRYKLGYNNYNQNDYAQNEELEAEPEENSNNVNITLVRNKVEEEGFEVKSSLDEREKQYPNYLFEDILLVNEDEVYIEYFKMVNDESSINLFYDLKDELVEMYSKDDKTDVVTKDNKKGFNLYALETDEGYAIVIRDKDSVMYAHCDKHKTEWIKNFIYELGY